MRFVSRLRVVSGLAVLASLVSGCASDGEVIDRSESDCPGGLTRPFALETLIDVARANGVSLKRDLNCGGAPSDVERAANIVLGDDVVDDEEVDAREGHVICDIEDLPLAEPPFAVRRIKWADDQETNFDVANVHCAIYPSAEGQLERLDAALRALAEAPVEQRSCTPGPPRPVTLKRLIETASKHGLRLLPDARCIEPGVVAQASTIVPYQPPAEQDPAVFADQGDVTCLVRGSAVPEANELVTTRLSVGKRFDLRNVSCIAIPSYGDEAVQLGRVEATMEDLARALD